MRSRIFYLPYFLLLTGVISLFSACNKEQEETALNPDELYTAYLFTYDAQKDSTFAYVAFCEGGPCAGNLVNLSPKESITCNGAALKTDATNTYVKAFPGYVQNGTYVWKAADGQTFTNKVSLEPIAFPADLNTINRAQNLTLTWNGKMVQPAEVVVLTFPGYVVGDGFMVSTQTPGAQDLLVPTSELNKVKTLDRQLILDRQKFIPLQQGGRTGGSLRTIYRDYKEVVFQ